jgi:Tfp pilus assembly protein PilN
MRVPLNLAREPFRRDRPMLIASAAVCILLSMGLVFLSSTALAERRESRSTRVALNAVDRQIARMQSEQARLEGGMRQPANAVVLDRSILFNDIIRRKSISWTRIFSDLETVLPHNVRVSSIHPHVNSRDELSLDMTVEADSPEPVIGFIAKLEGSDVFGSTQVSTITLPTQNDNFYRYRLSVTYAQKL